MRLALSLTVAASAFGCLQPSGKAYYPPADTTPPVVLSTVPVDGASGVHTGAFLQAVFSKEMDDSTTAQAATLFVAATDAGLPLNAYDFDLDGGIPDVYQWYPASGFQNGTAYVFTVRDTATDSYGNALQADVVIHFQTAP